MSLDKTKKRLEKVRQANRALRNLGQVALSEPGPWFSVPTAYRFDPSFFRNLISAEPPADSTVIGDSVPRLS
jgi:hypothetical protein